jgi:hypothetical protein
MGKECPVFHDIQLERQERDERKLIKVNNFERSEKSH